MEDYNLRLTFTMNVTRKDIFDILDVAFEGAIGYWADVHNHEEELGENHLPFIDGTMFDIYDAEDWDDFLGVLDESTILKGIERAIEQGYLIEYKWFRMNGNGIELDLCNVDAEVADVIVQLGMFDDIIYG